METTSSTDHSTLITPHFKNCHRCGAAVPWEPTQFADLGLSFLDDMPIHCDPCELAIAREKQHAARQERVEKCKAQLAACIGERIRNTDITHAEFNAKAWATIGKTDITAHNNILLVGPAGTCKSRMLYLLCKTATWKGYSIDWIRTTDITILSEQMAKYDTRANARERLQRLKYVDRLVLDDLGKTKWTPKEEEIAWEILDYRYEHQKPVWISANTHPEHLLMESYFTRDRGAPLVGRMLESAIVYNLSHTTP
jgi:DNA replication protein DnaC